MWVHAKSLQLCLTLWGPMDCSPCRLFCPWDSTDKNTGVGCHFLLQGIFLTQGLDPHLLLGRWILYYFPGFPPGKPRVYCTWAHAKSLQSCLTLCSPMDCSPYRLFCPWVSTDKNTGVGCHFILQRIFPTQRSNLHFMRLLDCKWILYH